jgi:putative Ca2+/H+ antiporter (TMEM165/GDT1 family)
MLTMNVKSGVRSSRVKGPFLTTSLMIILTELGDKTQIVTIALAARFTEALAVFTGVLSAFVMIDGLSIILADRLGKRVRAGKVKKVSAIMFIVLGILTVLGML